MCKICGDPKCKAVEKPVPAILPLLVGAVMRGGHSEEGMNDSGKLSALKASSTALGYDRDDDVAMMILRFEVDDVGLNFGASLTPGQAVSMRDGLAAMIATYWPDATAEAPDEDHRDVVPMRPTPGVAIARTTH